MTCYERYTCNKRALPNTLILVQCGDFYETFGNDAIIVAKLLDLPLTHRKISQTSKVALTGIVYHKLDEIADTLQDAGLLVNVLHNPIVG